LIRVRVHWLVLAYGALYAVGYLSRPLYGVAAIWPAHALSFAVLALLPVRRWPWVALAMICCDFVVITPLSRLGGVPHRDLYVLFGYAIANVLTACGPAALARGFGLLQTQDGFRVVISPLWIVALLVGVAPGALWGGATWALQAGTSFSAAEFGLWGLAAVLAIVSLAPAIFGMLLGYSPHAKPVAKPWEGLAVGALALGLFLWLALMPWPAVDVLVQPMLFTIPLVWLALRFSQRLTNIATAVVAAGIALLAEYRGGSQLSPSGVPAWSDMVISIDVFLLIGCGGALLVNFMTVKQRALLAELAREHEQLRQYAQALDSAEEAARRSTAADLHDGIGQVLAGQSMTLAAMRAHATQPKLAALVEEAIEASREAQEGLRLMIQDLSPPELEQASLEEILRWLEELFKSRFGFTVEHRILGGGTVGRDRLQLVYRCIREMLMNACKHSGRKAASIEVKVTDRWVTVTVSDDGVGFDPRIPPLASKGSFGLAQLRERVRAAGGALKLASAVGQGCRATVRLPV
jgi:signal transduction histidine kinase